MGESTRDAGRFIADALAGAGIRIAYTVPGESFLPLLDGMVAAGIRVVAARHEGGAGFMAAAHGALTGRPAAVVVTRAVGAANLAIALHAAHADSAPLVAIVGQVDRASRGREAFQEADVVATLGGLCRWAREVRDVAALPGALDEALRKATTARPGPVLLSLPADLLEGPPPSYAGRMATATVLGPSRSPEPDSIAVRRILHLLLDAERPVILAGAGVLRSRATADLVRLAEMLDVPVVAAWRRPDAFPNDHALYLGMSGYFAAPTVAPRLRAADGILVLGCRLNEVASHGWTVPAPGARWAHVDIEPLAARAGLGAPTIALAADARTFVREARRLLGGAVLEMVSLERRRQANAADREAYLEARVVDATPWDGPGVHPGRVIATLGQTLPPDAIVTTDAGHFGGWAARGLWTRRPGTYIGTTAGAMGFGLPAAIAASIASPGRPVVALVGDGGLGMTAAELETAVREGARFVVLVFDNARYGTIHDHQTRRGLAPIATDLGPVDWAMVAEGHGAAGVHVETDEEFGPALRAALASRRPTVLHLVVDRRWVSVDRLDGESAVAVAEAVAQPGAAAEGEVQVGPDTEAEPELEADALPEPEAEADADVVPEPGPPAAFAPDAEDAAPIPDGDGADDDSVEARSEA
ncbi:MAG TPA: thiamine pyrophosphate-dependent enzyme [Patescibacteria group bacterium]|nr:thiamine pyrophosphate-dependent enzyme [Patescibacteria group bacterium]